MILGIGTDIVYVPRISNLWKKFGTKFLKRVFSEKEIEDSKKYTNFDAQVRHFAKRFAAKEAYVKAVGTGFGKSIKMPDIIVSNNLHGKPQITINNSNIKYKIELSISDEKDYAIAFVVLYTEL
ncbi:holo-[acyl-carrier-protein] synthase [Ehrlichia chaffeensis str. Heartland]|uniref:Holo-[acyl-carrier-protein] synthase n=1 Tax=Ehrlichia chaffeensis (strain ATCC CRL-10679 / Arkansas) TaxID=205920 RepID=ACPS_EHRCR|nr:holo-[acyl-carrier-protein] synthase [Ehrlichia chaffeensis]Q2GG91.1 RecName: Full=Holo-[acyl-carrier-protein] synthase; Short=Holo-ACP synthase; AltName: Full=4'-phosphopantetheinyl transferase AcpS [Ehrlichia chaffeensis str. Arkansas]ABD45080.1 holo-(acyl-carrier-protein) synthase [Ehrlichia chaffeensis str. Arkansas]AHX03806.1 holo-[acyl-carrier-protein] synthase [Ehrlichia chaffeensis str. Heartland]AHX05468.1 holo-[acyl-carrier-protein] synthase [Ehrlichia chaffeensis str. Jax]AHX0645